MSDNFQFAWLGLCLFESFCGLMTYRFSEHANLIWGIATPINAVALVWWIYQSIKFTISRRTRLQIFRDWIESKSKSLHELKSESQFWRWKRSMLKGILLAIEPECEWDKQFYGSYCYEADEITTISYENMINNYDMWLHGMINSVTNDHFRKDFKRDMLEF